jgi:hypothetical protein
MSTAMVVLVACGGNSSDPPDAGGNIDATAGCEIDSQCNDHNGCTIDTCNNHVCTFTVDDQQVGQACDDGLACTTGDSCTAEGKCEGPPTDCASTGDACNEGVCDEAHNGCYLAPKTDGTTCDDAKFCTTGDTCTAGVCGGAPLDCSAEDGQCTTGVCSEEHGQCEAEPKQNGTTCDDGVFCTDADACTEGVCGGAPKDCSAAGDSCNVGTCNEATQACVATPSNEGGTCNDGAFCTVNDKCTAGHCGGAAKDCSSASNQCATGTCNEDTDACVAVAANNGAACNDGSACTVSDVCGNGTCAGVAKDCSAFSNQCNTGTCNATSGACQATPANNAMACNDGQFCTTGEVCSNGTCGAGAPLSCGDTSTCTTDVCNETSDTCDHNNTPHPGAEGPPGSPTCSDGIDNDCDGQLDGADANCVGCLTGADCNDNNPCTADVCTTGTCHNNPSSGASCDDGNFCTVTDVCTAGVCGGAARDCSAAGDQCNNGTCNEATNACVPTPKANGTTCSDGSFCTNPDSCTNGVCGGAARDCSAVADACNTGACNETTDACVKAPKANGTTCNDALFCTTNDACTAGVCGGTARDCSASGNACNTGTCNEATDACAPTPKPNGTACDTLFCQDGETCLAGNCQGGTAATCSDGNNCTTDTCNEASDTCAHPSRTVNPASLVASTSTDATPQTVCMVAGSGARVLVWTELKDTAGQAISGGSVTIGGVAATESTTAPGSYYREVVAGATAGMQSLTVVANACSSTTTLTQTVVVTTVAANAGSGGTGGCTPSDGNLRVKVVSAETGAAIAGASVLVGAAQANAFEHSPEGVLGGTSTFASNVATTDASGFATFYDYGGPLGVPFTITAGADTRAYLTVADANASDVVMALPLLHPAAPATTTYTNGTGPGTVTGCDDLDASIILPKLKLDFFSGFDINALFGKSRCWDSTNAIVHTVAIPENLFLPAQQIGPFCIGGNIAAAPWSITLNNTASTGQTENLEIVAVSLPALDANTAISSGGFSALLSLLTFRNVGWKIGENVPTNPNGRMLTAPDDYTKKVTITYGTRPTETDIIGLTGADYSGQNGSGSIFLLGSQVHKFDAAGSTVVVANSDLNDASAPTGVRRFASVAATYLDATKHMTIPANRLKGKSAVLVRGASSGAPPVGSGDVSISTAGMLNISGTTPGPNGLFTWENASLGGNSPLYSVHELSVRTNSYLPVLSACQTTNQVRDAESVQWIVMRPFGATCTGGSECFTLPTLPASFPRAASSATKKSGFEARLGSGAACTGAGQGNCAAGEVCVDPDAAGALTSMCMTGAGTAASPYVVQDYFWKLHLYDLELAASWTWNAFNFVDRLLFMTHESTNEATF